MLTKVKLENENQMNKTIQFISLTRKTFPSINLYENSNKEYLLIEEWINAENKKIAMNQKIRKEWEKGIEKTEEIKLILY